MSTKLYIGVDLGTSAVKLLLVDGAGAILNTVSREYPLIFPHPGWSEQEPAEWWRACSEGIHELLNGFDASRVHDAAFSGTCRVGRFTRHFELPGGVRKPAGIYRATLHNVTVGDEARLYNIRSYIANYDVGDGAHIGNVDKIYVDGDTSGTESRCRC